MVDFKVNVQKLPGFWVAMPPCHQGFSVKLTKTVITWSHFLLRPNCTWEEDGADVVKAVQEPFSEVPGLLCPVSQSLSNAEMVDIPHTL